MNINDIESKVELAESQIQEASKEKENLELRDQHFEKAISKLEKDTEIAGKLNEKRLLNEKQRENAERELRERKHSAERIREQIDEKIEDTLHGMNVLKELQELGENVDEAQEILDKRLAVLEECKKRIDTILEILGDSSDICRGDSGAAASCEERSAGSGQEKKPEEKHPEEKKEEEKQPEEKSNSNVTYDPFLTNGPDTDNTENDINWNIKFKPSVEKNIRVHFEELFPGFFSKEEMDYAIEHLTFVSHRELQRIGGPNIGRDTVGFNDGHDSYVSDNVRRTTDFIEVDGNFFKGSGSNTPINVAFVTAVHETFHMLSANDEGPVHRRGIKIENDQFSGAMNEAITEYFTYLACGGDRKEGGLYPGKHSQYTPLMAKVPILEKTVGRDVIAEAYFHNRPDVLSGAVDSILGDGSWRKLCEASYDLAENHGRHHAADRVDEVFDALKKYNEQTSAKKEQKEQYLRLKVALISEKIRRMQDGTDNGDDSDDAVPVRKLTRRP